MLNELFADKVTSINSKNGAAFPRKTIKTSNHRRTYGHYLFTGTGSDTGNLYTQHCWPLFVASGGAKPKLAIDDPIFTIK